MAAVENSNRNEMGNLKTLVLICFLGISISTFADTSKVYIEYEHSDKSAQNKLAIKLYKDGNKYKLTRKLSNSPTETGIVTAYIDIDAASVITVTEKDGTKRGVKAAWDDNYWGLFMEFPVLFRGIPEGKGLSKLTKLTDTETINGRVCDIYQSAMTILGASNKYYMWSNIMLKSVSPGNSTIAELVDENPIFAADEFIVPSDVTY